MAAFMKVKLLESNTHEFVNVDHVVKIVRDPEAPDQRTVLVLRKDVGKNLVVAEDFNTVTHKIGL